MKFVGNLIQIKRRMIISYFGITEKLSETSFFFVLWKIDSKEKYGFSILKKRCLRLKLYRRNTRKSPVVDPEILFEGIMGN